MKHKLVIKCSFCIQFFTLKKSRRICFVWVSICYTNTHILAGSMMDGNPFASIMPHVSHMGQVGISVEPLSQLSQQTPEAGTSVSKVDSFVEFSQKMLENFFNYASSFAVTQSQMTPNPREAYVTLNVLQNWFQNFQRRLQQNPYFWRG